MTLARGCGSVLRRHQAYLRMPLPLDGHWVKVPLSRRERAGVREAQPVGGVWNGPHPLPGGEGMKNLRYEASAGRQTRHGRYPAAAASAAEPNGTRCRVVMRRAWRHVGKQKTPVVSLP